MLELFLFFHISRYFSMVESKYRYCIWRIHSIQCIIIINIIIYLLQLFLMSGSEYHMLVDGNTPFSNTRSLHTILVWWCVLVVFSVKSIFFHRICNIAIRIYFFAVCCHIEILDYPGKDLVAIHQIHMEYMSNSMAYWHKDSIFHKKYLVTDTWRIFTIHLILVSE